MLAHIFLVEETCAYFWLTQYRKPNVPDHKARLFCCSLILEILKLYKIYILYAIISTDSLFFQIFRLEDSMKASN